MNDEVVRKTFLGGIEPISIQCSNGAVVYVTVNVIRRDMHTDSLRWFADMIEKKEGTTREVIVSTG